jgi:hypothetical protein
METNIGDGAGKYGLSQKGLIAYAIAPFGTATVTTEGYYYFDGAAWKPLGGGVVAQPFVISPEINGHHDVTNESFVRLNAQTPGYRVNLPNDGTSPVGRIIYVSNMGSQDVIVTPDMRNNAYLTVLAGQSGAWIYLGGTGNGSWDWIGGW